MLGKNCGLFIIILVLLFCPGLSASSLAQEKQEKKEAPADPKSPKQEKGEAAKPAAGAKKGGTRELGIQWPRWLQPTMAIRGRLEQPWGRGFSTHNEDLYYLGRFSIGAAVTPSKYLTFFAMGQDSRLWFYNDLTTRTRGMKHTFDLRQLYADLHVKKGERTVAFRLGRQYLDFGGRRLVAVPTWGNYTSIYDAARLTYSDQAMKIDVFASTRISDIYTYKAAKNRPGENLYGIYTEFMKLIPYSSFQPYILWRTQPNVIGESLARGDSDLWTMGFRWTGKLPNRLDFVIEEVLQRGTYANDDVSAYGMIYTVGYTVTAAKWKPRLSLEVNYASGDASRTDGKRQTFDQLYPSNHGVFGIADQVGWRNIFHTKYVFDCAPHPKIKLLLSINEHYLATVQDGLYNSSGIQIVRNTKATSRHIGWEPNIQFDYAFNKKWSAGFGVARLFPGKYLKQSTAGHAYTYPYLMWEYKF